LDIRFQTTCCSRSGSPAIGAAPESSVDDLRERGRVALDRLDGAVAPVRRDDAGVEHARVAEDGVERGAKLVRQRREELVLDPAGLADAEVEAGILERDRRPGCDAGGETLVRLGEPAGLRVREEQAAEHVPGRRLHRHRQIAAQRRQGVRLPRVGEPRIARDVIEARHRVAAEGRVEQIGPAQRREGLALRRSARHRVEQMRLARLQIDRVVGEGADLGAGAARRGFDHRLDDAAAVELGGDRRPHLVQHLGDRSVLFGVVEQAKPLGLGRPPIADVADDFRRADDPAAAVADRGDGQRDRKERAVLALPDRFEVVDLVAAAQARQHVVFFALAVGGNQGADRFPDDLLGGVAEHLLRGGVPRRDDAIEILAGDRVVAGFDDGGEVAGGTLEALDAADVLVDADGAGDGAAVVQDRKGGRGDGHGGAVAPLSDGGDVAGLFAREQPSEEVPFLATALFREQDSDGTAQDLIGRPAIQPLRRGIPRSDDAPSIRPDNRVVARFEDGAQQRRAIQLLLHPRGF
jgi:hypothetical protein